MTAEEQKRYINYLVERLEQADLGLRARDAVLQDFLDEKKILVERLSKLDTVLSDVKDLKKNLASEVKKRKAAKRKVDDFLSVKTLSKIFNSISVKPNEQSKACFGYVMARKCIKLNI